MTTQPQHTPLPWKILDGISIVEENNDDEPIVHADLSSEERSIEEVKANIEFIVRACNSHYDLIAELSFFVDLLDSVVLDDKKWEIYRPHIERIQYIIAKAEKIKYFDSRSKEEFTF